MPLDVTVWTTTGEDGIDFDNVDFVSFVNHETFGKPAIVSEDDRREGVRVLYVNVNNIACAEVTKS